jgi:ParB-like chromosome segregation protein Spo0J
MSVAFDTRAVASIHLISLDSLGTHEGIRSGGLSEGHIALLMETADEWPPILVWEDENMVVDGAHRVEAARRLGLRSIAAAFFYGTREAAFVESIRRNVDHGLPLSVGDRRRSARRILSRHAEWSDRRIASVCGLSGKTVARMRHETLSLVQPSDGVVVGFDRRVGRDGKERPVRGAEVRDRIRQALEDNPTGSLRAIAALAGASPETVRSVKARLADEAPRRRMVEPAGVMSEMYGHVTAPTTTIGRVPSTSGDREVDLAPSKWLSDPALLACRQGSDFAQWFESNRVDEDWHRYVPGVPLGRVYEIVDEARRRAATWMTFASVLEGRTRS